MSVCFGSCVARPIQLASSCVRVAFCVGACAMPAHSCKFCDCVASRLYCARHREIMRAIRRQAGRTQHTEDLQRILALPWLAGLFMEHLESNLTGGMATMADPLGNPSDSEWAFWMEIVRYYEMQEQQQP